MKIRTIRGLVAASTVGVLAVAAVALGLSAHATEPEPAAETVQADVRPQPDAGVVASPVDLAEAAPAAGVDPMAADYNEYTDPNSPTFVTDAEKIIWWGKQSVVKKCMTDKGLAYDDARWWHGENSQPQGLSYDESIAWTKGYLGEEFMNPTGIPEESGCSGLLQLMDEGTIAIPTVALPAETAPALTERQRWLAHQDLVRTCMTEAGFDYLYWEWWNPKYQTPFDPLNTEPVIPAAQPVNLSGEQREAWNLALDGNAGLGADYRWQDAGCWGYAVHASGNDNMH